jgi:hypothetical protein
MPFKDLVVSAFLSGEKGLKKIRTLATHLKAVLYFDCDSSELVLLEVLTCHLHIDT